MTHHPRKRFGQHFLQDAQIIQQIIAAIAPQPQQHFVEIGPGQGVLTKELLPRVKKLDVIEIDRDLAQQLKQDYPQLSVHVADVLRFDFTTLGSNLQVVGNLPYNISSPLLFHLFQHLAQIDSMCFMLQKEFVLRMTAPVNDAHYSRLSVMTQYFCDSTFLFEVPPSAFAPPPKVDSAVVFMRPRHDGPRAKDLTLFSKLVQTAFNFRRKTLHNCLKGFVSDTMLQQLGIDPAQRPQTLSVADFVTLANCLAS